MRIQISLIYNFVEFWSKVRNDLNSPRFLMAIKGLKRKSWVPIKNRDFWPAPSDWPILTGPVILGDRFYWTVLIGSWKILGAHSLDKKTCDRRWFVERKLYSISDWSWPQEGTNQITWRRFEPRNWPKATKKESRKNLERVLFLF